jgi:hypothetical protein
MTTELETKQTVLNLFEERHPDFINEARKLARWFCYSNQGFKAHGVPNTVTADDVRDMMMVNTRKDTDNNTMGSIFRKGFKRVGFTQSKAEGGHGRVIGLWSVA